MQTSLGFVTQAYAALGAAVREIDEPGSWRQTGCLGWSARDLTVHCWSDAQRALVALHSPVSATPDVDAVTYWRGWGAGDADGVGAANGRRFNRVVASLFLDWSVLRGEYLDTASAVVHAARASRRRGRQLGCSANSTVGGGRRKPLVSTASQMTPRPSQIRPDHSAVELSEVHSQIVRPNPTTGITR